MLLPYQLIPICSNIQLVVDRIAKQQPIWRSCPGGSLVAGHPAHWLLQHCLCWAAVVRAPQPLKLNVLSSPWNGNYTHNTHKVIPGRPGWGEICRGEFFLRHNSRCRGQTKPCILFSQFRTHVSLSFIPMLQHFSWLREQEWIKSPL